MCSGLTEAHIHGMSPSPRTALCITNKEYFKDVLKYMECNVRFYAGLSVLTTDNTSTLTLYIFSNET